MRYLVKPDSLHLSLSEQGQPQIVTGLGKVQAVILSSGNFQHAAKVGQNVLRVLLEVEQKVIMKSRKKNAVL